MFTSDGSPRVEEKRSGADRARILRTAGLFALVGVLSWGAARTIGRCDAPASGPEAVFVLGPGTGGSVPDPETLRYPFTREEYVHPRIVEELVGWLSDPGGSVVAIDLVAGNDSNRFFGDVALHEVNGHIWVECRDGTDGGFFRYRLVGVSPSGVHVLHTARCGGGTGVFADVLLVSVRSDSAVLGATSGVEARDRVLLCRLGSLGLGDRYSGDVTYRNGVLRIGPDESRTKFGGRVAAEEFRIR